MFYGILLTDKGQGVGERIPITRGRALPITLTAWAQVQGKVFTSGGRIVRNFSVINPTATKGAPDYYAVPPGDHMIIWEGRNDSGELVAPGDYYTMLETRTLQAPATIQVRPEQNNGTRQRVTRTRTQDDTIFEQLKSGWLHEQNDAVNREEYRSQERKPPLRRDNGKRRRDNGKGMETLNTPRRAKPRV
jgi:hypothetical protein